MGQPCHHGLKEVSAVNALQPKVVKANSKAKGNLTLHPLPNTDNHMLS